MKRQPQQLTIDKPCHENWDAMTPARQGRHCQACSKTVIDFSVMGDEAIISTLEKNKGATCGRFYADQLNRELVVIPQPKPAPFFYRMLASVLLMFGVGSANAQTSRITANMAVSDGSVFAESKTQGEISIRATGDNTIFSGRLLAYRDKGIEGTITFEGTTYKVKTDSEGYFSMEVPHKLLSETMNFTATAPGFVSKTVTVQLTELPLKKEIYLLNDEYKRDHFMGKIARPIKDTE